jgi:hypothetical protein
MGITHPPKNFFFGGVIRQNFNISCGPAAAANNQYLVFWYMH